MELTKKSDAKILAVVNPIMDNHMLGSSEINHKKHTKDFTEGMEGIVSEEYLEKVCRSYLETVVYEAARRIRS